MAERSRAVALPMAESSTARRPADSQGLLRRGSNGRTTFRLRKLPTGVRSRTHPKPTMNEGVDETESSGEESLDDDGAGEDDRGSCSCNFCNPQAFLIVILVAFSSAAYAGAIWYGVKQGPSWEQLLHPKQWFARSTQMRPENQFALFDRDHDGLVGKADVMQLAELRFGERPSSKQVEQYIAAADVDGDGALDEREFRELLRLERSKAASKGRH